MEQAEIQHRLRIGEQLEEVEQNKHDIAYKSFNSSMLNNSPKRDAYFASRKYTGMATFYDSDD